MASERFWDFYEDRKKQFSADARQQAYKEYQDALAKRATESTQALDESLEDRLVRRWNIQTAKEFYLKATQIHDKVAFDFNLLSSLVNNKALFHALPPDLQARIKYYYQDHALWLRDEATIPNNRYDIEFYEKTLGIESKKVTITAADAKKASFSDILNQRLKAWFLFYPETILFGFAFSNIYRLLTRFYILTWLEIWSIGRQQGWLDQFDRLAGVLPIDTYLLQSTTPIFNALSLFLFFGRFVVDFGKMIQRVIWPNENEKLVNYVERARIVWRKSYLRSVNDILWTIFNLLTNYASQLAIPLPIAGWLLVGFLLFDVCWFWHKWDQAKKAVSNKEKWLKSAALHESFDPLIKQMAQIELRQLECKRAQNRGEFLFCLAAALLLVASFTLLLVFSGSPLAGSICLFACTVAVAMYITSDQFGAGVRASHECRLNEADYGFGDLQNNKEYLQGKVKAKQAAWNKFGENIAEALIIPSILIGLYTINLPAAVALTVAYVAFKIITQNESAKAVVSKNMQAVADCFWVKGDGKQAEPEGTTPLLA